MKEFILGYAGLFALVCAVWAVIIVPPWAVGKVIGIW